MYDAVSDSAKHINKTAKYFQRQSNEKVVSVQTLHFGPCA